MIIDLVVIALTSSLDNFVIGVTLGGHRSYTLRLNGVVALANAAGAGLSALVGSGIGLLAPRLAGLVAALTFLVLGASEAASAYRKETSSFTDLALVGDAWKLAVPMTLNNVAGGVSGGLSDLPPAAMAVSAFIASFALMHLGNAIGASLATTTTNGDDHKRESSSCTANAISIDPRILAACAFAFLGISQLFGLVHDR